MTEPPRALVLTGFGINCDVETTYAFERAGARAERVHLNDLITDPDRLARAQILAVPGGFSFGDDIASGRILANRLRYRLGEALREFVAAGKLVIGICNGFQVLVKMGMLPAANGAFRQTVTLAHNDSGRFEDRWVRLRIEVGVRCVWLEGMDELELPVRHGEGKFVPLNEGTIRELEARGQIALRYCRPDGSRAGGEYPFNPNGSIGDVAGMCDTTGRVFGLMPHPEAYVWRTNHPCWTRLELPEEGAGLAVFRNAVKYATRSL
jgi:phosphoribosylformylglycinamidine synthase